MPSPTELAGQHALDIRNEFQFSLSEVNQTLAGYLYDVDRPYKDLFSKLYKKIQDSFPVFIALKDEILALDDFGYFYSDMDLNNLASRIISDVDAQGTAAFNSFNTVINTIQDKARDIINSIRPQIILDLSSIENTVRVESDKTKNDLTTTLNTIQSNITNEVEAAKIQANNVAGLVVKTLTDEIENAAQKTQDVFGSLLGNVQSFFQNAPDDIARRIWEYFRDFFFQKVV